MEEDDDNEEEDEEEDEEESGGLMISMGEDGKAKIEKESDYIRVPQKDINIISEFLKENQDLFNKWIKKKKYAFGSQVEKEVKNDNKFNKRRMD